MSVNLEYAAYSLSLWASHIIALGVVIPQALKLGQVSYLLHLLEAVNSCLAYQLEEQVLPSYLKQSGIFQQEINIKYNMKTKYLKPI